MWPAPADGIVAISASQLAYMLDGIDWRNPVRTLAPGGRRLSLRPIDSPYGGPVMWDNRSRDDDGR